MPEATSSLLRFQRRDRSSIREWDLGSPLLICRPLPWVGAGDTFPVCLRQFFFFPPFFSEKLPLQLSADSRGICRFCGVSKVEACFLGTGMTREGTLQKGVTQEGMLQIRQLEALPCAFFWVYV